MSRGSRGGRRPNYAESRTRVAAELNPEQAPFWVSQSSRTTPAQEWWWTPKGAAHPYLLRHNHIHAEMALLAALGRSWR